MTLPINCPAKAIDLKKSIWQMQKEISRISYLVVFLPELKVKQSNTHLPNAIVPWGRSREPIIESFELAFYFSSRYAIIGNVWQFCVKTTTSVLEIHENMIKELSFCNTENTLTYLKF